MIWENYYPETKSEKLFCSIIFLDITCLDTYILNISIDLRFNVCNDFIYLLYSP